MDNDVAAALVVLRGAVEFYLQEAFTSEDAREALHTVEEMLCEVGRSGVVLDDPRLDYVEIQVDRQTFAAARALAEAAPLPPPTSRVKELETRLREIQHTDRWCICPFSVVDYPHMTACPLGIAAELLAMLPPPTPAAGTEGRDGT